MQSTLPKKILKLIETKHLTTLTVDIFDTILLNDYWPKALRQYELAGQWTGDICHVAALQVTVYELFALRRQAERELRFAGRPLQIDLVLDAMLDLLCAKYSIKLSSDDRLQLLATMIASEIQFQIYNSHPNHSLIAALNNIKERYPELKIYFVTDTPFFAEQIKTILQIFGIKIFDDGISSSDVACEKQSGDLYETLSSKLPFDFDLMHNLHLGDHRTPDYLMPILHDSSAIHYRPMRMRGLRTLVGKTALHIIEINATRREKRRYKQLSSLPSNAGSDWKQYGLLLAQIEQIWTTQINLQAELNDQVTYLLTSSLNDLKSNRANVLSTTLDKNRLVRAYVWLLATFDTSRWNAGKLLQLVAKEAGITHRTELYKVCFGKDYVVSEFALTSQADTEFYPEFLAEIKTMEAEPASLLRQDYEYVLGLLTQKAQLCLIEKVNDGTAKLFQEFARLHGATNNISEWILDLDGTVTQSEQCVQPSLNARRHKYILRGKQNATAVLRQVELAPSQYLQKILLPELKRLAKIL